MMNRKYRVRETEPTYLDCSVLCVMHLFGGVGVLQGLNKAAGHLNTFLKICNVPSNLASLLQPCHDHQLLQIVPLQRDSLEMTSTVPLYRTAQRTEITGLARQRATG